MTWEELDKADPAELLLVSSDLGEAFPPLKLDSSVTIGMAAHGNFDITLFTLRALLASVSGEYELILVDDASPDLTGKLFELVPYIHSNTKVFRFPINIEYSGSLNTILSHASGNKIIFLSNDIFVSPAYIAELLSVSDIHKDAGLVRGCSNFVDNGLKTHNISNCGNLNNFMDLFHYAQIRSKNYSGEWFDDPFLTGDAFLVSRSLLETVGFLDEKFFGYFVDHDLGVRARQAGFRPRLALGAFAWHQHESNFDYLPENEKHEKRGRRWARVNQNWAVFKQKYSLQANMGYEGIRRIPWDGLAGKPLVDHPKPCDNSKFCLPAPETPEWVAYRVSELSEQAKRYMYSGMLEDAESLCNKAILLTPDNSAVQTVLATIQVYQGRLALAMKTFRHALKLDPANFKAHSNLLLCMNYAEGSTQQAIYRESRKWEKQHCPTNASISPIRLPRSRIRIAYISPDFRRHSVGYFFLPLLENHDRSKFEVYCLSDAKNIDDMTKQMITLADGWRDISLLSDDEVESVIREVAPDILIDLAGHTGQIIRLGLFSKRLAPVQVTWLGYPNTTGLTSMDYRITDFITDPHGVSDKLHSEKLVRIADCFICYKPPENAPDISPLPALTHGYITFGSFNILPKIQDSVINAWSQILKNVPDSKLFFKSHYLRDDATVARMLQRFNEFGITSDRLIIKPSDPDTVSHLAQYENIDVALDTFPYNGTTTTCEALWMGVPVVTLSGDRHSGRVGESLLSAVGLCQNTAYSFDEYVEKAVSIASNLDKLSVLRMGLRTTMRDSSLCCAESYAKKFEDALKNI
jgi:predicted O-linked N-acetylglucosamine transferase (SPINDLY family)/GT2 family glycosyltransferase